MKEQKNERIYLELWNPETDTYYKLGFLPEDIDFLMEKEIISTDSLGAAMNDQDAFEVALLEMTGKNRPFSYSDLVGEYLSLTKEDIIIKA